MNPELELLRFLTAHGFPHIAAAAAAGTSTTGRSIDATLGIAAGVPRRRASTAGSSRSTSCASDPDGASSTRLARARRGDRRRCTPRSPPTPPTRPSRPEEPSPEALSLLTATVDEEIERVFLDLPDDERARADRRPRRRTCASGCARSRSVGVGGRVIRPHGDLHLGQTLLTDARLGDPRLRGRAGAAAARAAPQALAAARRRRDAALVRLRRRRRPRCCAARPAPDGWEAARPRALPRRLPRRASTRRCCRRARRRSRKLLAVFELEKAVYELRYELDNRPDWVAIPVAGIAAPARDGMRRRHARARRAGRAATTRTRTRCSAPTRTTAASSSARFRPARRARSTRRSSRTASRVALEQVHPAGVFEGDGRGRRAAAAPTGSRSTTATAATFTIDDPYRFPPTLGELDLHLLGEGRHEELYEQLGAHVREVDGVARHRVRGLGADRARRSASSATSTAGTAACTRCARSARPASGSCSCPASAPGARYKFEILRAGRRAAR